MSLRSEPPVSFSMRRLFAACSCAFSISLGLVSAISLLGAVSCATHAVVVGDVAQLSPASSPGSPLASSPLASSAALAAVAMLCVFVGGMQVAMRLCSLGFGLALIGVHLWLRTSDPAALANAADSLLVSVLLPVRNRLRLGPDWDCIFFGPADALYMLAAARHAASVLATLRGMTTMFAGTAARYLPAREIAAGAGLLGA